MSPDLQLCGGTSTNTYDTTQYSSTVICNTINIQDIVDSTIFTHEIPNDASGNPIGVYNPLTDEFIFSSNTASTVTATASFAINAALQAAFVHIVIAYSASHALWAP